MTGLAVLLYAGRYLERAWSSKEYAKFLGICTIVPTLLAFGLCSILYYLTGNTAFVYISTSLFLTKICDPFGNGGTTDRFSNCFQAARSRTYGLSLPKSDQIASQGIILKLFFSYNSISQDSTLP